MFASIARAARLIFDPGFAGIALRSVLLTLLMFLVGLAGRIEARDYPGASPLPTRFWPAFKAGMHLAAMVLAADLVLLPLDIGLPGLGGFLSLLANGWLLGWEYFELAALRHLPVARADILRKSRGWQVWGGGILIAFLSEIPLLDLIAPLFGTALMVHLFHRILRQETA